MRRSLIILSLINIFSLSYGQSKNSKYDNSFLHFHEYGQGDLVIILSGGPGNDCHQEEDVAIKLSTKYHVILLEQRGTGLSMPPILDETTINLDFAKRDLLFVMDSLKADKVILYGHSWGALLATAFAIEYPDKVKSLVLTGPGPMSMANKYWNPIKPNRFSKLTDNQIKRFNELYGKVDNKTITVPEMTEYSWLKNFMNVYDTTNQEYVFANINKGNFTSETYKLMIKDLNKIDFDLTEKIENLKMPITIVSGKEDPLAFLTIEFQKLAPKSNIYWIEKSGHFPMYEQPNDFYPKLFEAMSQK